MEPRKQILLRVYLVFFFLCLFGVAIFVQIVRVQFIEGDYWRSKADSLTLDYKTIEASRGNIFSDNGSLLATSVPIYDIRMDLRTLSDDLFNNNIDSLSYCLANLFKDKASSDYRRELRKAKAQGEGYWLIQRNISYKELQQLKRFPLFRLGRYKGGLLVEQKSMRELPYQLLAQRTIGYMRAVKPVGIEAAFNEEMEGSSGKRLMQKISGNVWIPVNDNNEVDPSDGHDIITTIDINIQDVAEHALAEQLALNNADHGCAVLMEVETGYIKAIANLKRTSSGTYSEEYNYAIGESTEPGSTMKLASLLAAIDDSRIEPAETVTVGNGFTTYSGQPMKDSHPPKASRLSVQQVFETSSNVGVSRIIYQNYAKEPERFIEKLKSFKLNEPLGLQIPGESNPVIKNTDDKKWSAVTLPWMSIGYEVQLTPLQTLAFYNAVANNGRKVRPLFVKEIRKNGVLVKEFKPEVIADSICSMDAIAKVKKMMEGVVDSGTASNIRNAHYKIAGKTGTAQTNYSAKRQTMKYQASFVGYFPADNPKYSCIVVVNSPSNNVYYGGAVAAPVFKEISDKVYSNHLELHTNFSDSALAVSGTPATKSGERKPTMTVMNKLNIPATVSADAQWVTVEKANTTMALKEKKIVHGLVPNVSGMGVRDAMYLLENSGLIVKVNGRGTVMKQSILPGSKLEKGQVIFLELGS